MHVGTSSSARYFDSSFKTPGIFWQDCDTELFITKSLNLFLPFLQITVSYFLLNLRLKTISKSVMF